METKTQKFRRLFKEEKYREALKVIKSFRRGFEVNNFQTPNMVWKCLSGNVSFYRKPGFNQDKVKCEAYEIMRKYVYGF